MYVVKAGEVDLLVRGQLAETVSVDGFFGELAMLDNSPRTATAVAKTDCTLIPINEKQFQFLSQEVPLFCLAIMRAMVGRIRSRTARFGVMPWQQPTRESIVRFLDHAYTSWSPKSSADNYAI
jgi:CRP-like cAMP-binding protein